MAVISKNTVGLIDTSGCKFKLADLDGEFVRIPNAAKLQAGIPLPKKTDEVQVDPLGFSLEVSGGKENPETTALLYFDRTETLKQAWVLKADGSFETKVSKIPTKK